MWLGSPSVADSRVLFERDTQGGHLLSTALQHVVLHVSLEGAVEVLKGIGFVQREDLTEDMTETQTSAAFCCPTLQLSHSARFVYKELNLHLLN